MIINKIVFKGISKVSLWKIGVIVFLGFFVVLSLLNLYFIFWVKNELAREPDITGQGFQNIDFKKLDQAVKKISERENSFETIMLERADIKDPSF